MFTDAAINHYEVEDIVFECVDNIAKVEINYYLHVLSLLKLLASNIKNGLVIFEYAKITVVYWWNMRQLVYWWGGRN